MAKKSSPKSATPKFPHPKMNSRTGGRNVDAERFSRMSPAQQFKELAKSHPGLAGLFKKK